MFSRRTNSRALRGAALVLGVAVMVLARADAATGAENGSDGSRNGSERAGAASLGLDAEAARVPAPAAPKAPPEAPAPPPAASMATGTPSEAAGPKPASLAGTDAPAQPSKSAQQLASEEFLQDVKEFEGESKDFQQEVRRIIQRKLAEKKEEVTHFYDQQIKSAEVAERDERLGAIALFERFLASYPNDEKYTPDAMLRLAELYYEKTKDDTESALARYEDRARMGVTDEAPPDTNPNYQKSIALYQDILTKFPNYRLNDAVMYLLGWALNEQGEADQARNEFFDLTQKYPQSRYVAEAWVRIGEYYFDYTSPDPVVMRNMLQEGLKAYQKALEYKDSPFYDKALYKLGWAYYRLNDYDNAVKVFLGLVDYYDAKKDADGGGDLRAEAIQYTADSFGDEVWGGADKLEAYLNARGAHSYDYQIFRKLGDYYYNTSRFDDAVQAYDKALARNPLAPDAPAIATILLKSMSQAVSTDPAHHKLEDVLIKGDELAARFASDKPWARANKDDTQALQAGRDLVEKVSLNNAQYWYKMATQFEATANDGTKPEDTRADANTKAIQYFKKAADSYAGYLHDFPRSKDVYSIQFAYAYSLYRSGQFLKAADVFTQVRDSHQDNTHFTDAAYYVVASLQKEIGEEENQGKLQRREPCIPVEVCKDLTDFKPLPIADIRVRLISAADTYLKRAPKAEDAAQLSYIAGRTFLTYFHFDDARKRYFDVVKRFPATEFAQLANDEILISYLLEKNWEAIGNFADQQLKENPVVKKDPKKVAYLQNIKYTARFNLANQAMTAKDFEKAAALYEGIVADSTAAGKPWDQSDKALFNAALCYREEHKFESAMSTFERIYTQFPNSPLAEGALFKVAEDAERSYNFEKAISQYGLLVERYTDKANEKDRQAAQYNKARLLEGLQRYQEAGREFQRYAEMFPDADDAPDMVYEAVTIYGRMHDNRNLISGLQNFIHRFERKPEQAEKIVEAYRKIAKAENEQKNTSAYRDNLRTCVKEYERLGMTPQNFRASQAASECAFELVEVDYTDFAKKKFELRSKNPKKFKDEYVRVRDDLAAQVKSLEDAYSKVITTYQWPDMMIAAMYRLGDVDDQFVNKLLDSPCPPFLAAQGEEACQVFKDKIGEFVLPITERSASAFQKASDKAFDLRIVNEWSKRAMEMVCRNTPKNCRSLKDPREEFIRNANSPLPLLRDADGTLPLQTSAPAPQPAPKPAAPAAPAAQAAPTNSIGAPGTIVVPMAPAGTPAPGTTPASTATPAPAAGPAVQSAPGVPTTVILPPATGGTP